MQYTYPFNIIHATNTTNVTASMELSAIMVPSQGLTAGSEMGAVLFLSTENAIQ